MSVSMAQSKHARQRVALVYDSVWMESGERVALKYPKMNVVIPLKMKTVMGS